jgi:hypothetical protein
MDRNGEAYQRRAFDVLPILVSRAGARQPISYGELASQIRMPNHRNLNFVLGSIGTSLDELGSKWGREVPRLQALVVNQESGLPGEAFMSAYVDPKLPRTATRIVRKQFVDSLLAAVYSYPDWHAVLQHFELAPLPVVSPAVLDAAAAFSPGGEGAEHRALKEFVASHPASVGIRERVLSKTVECPLPSGDCIDVLFHTKRRWIAIEVKPSHAPEHDLIRGIFQCVKYTAVLDALARSQGTLIDVQARLAVGGELTAESRDLAGLLGIDAHERLQGSAAPTA